MMMKGTPREGRVAEEGGGARGRCRKEAVTSVNNIRESSYKIARIKSNRTDHSLSTKKPITLHPNPQTLSKPRLQTNKDTPNTPAHTQSLQEKYSKTAETKYGTTPVNKNTPNKPVYRGETEMSIVKKEIPSEGTRKNSELDCLQAIWENTKTLKASGFFPSEILQLQSILQRMVFKLAHQENCLSSGQSSPNTYKRHQLKATCDTENAISGRIQHLFQDHKLSFAAGNEGRQSIKSSYGSLKIQNQDSHKLQYLQIYQQASMLRDITNSYRISSQRSHSNSLSSNQKSSSFRREEKSQMDDRIYLRSIVKRTKPPNETRPTASNGDCCKQTQGMGALNLSYECQLLSCEGGKEVVSSSSSESKREVLNQIISMLNRKYQRSLKGDPGKVFI